MICFYHDGLNFKQCFVGTMKSTYFARSRMMILTCRINRNFASNLHAPTIEHISIDLGLNRGNVLDRHLNMSYAAYNRSNFLLKITSTNHVHTFQGDVCVD